LARLGRAGTRAASPPKTPTVGEDEELDLSDEPFLPPSLILEVEYQWPIYAGDTNTHVTLFPLPLMVTVLPPLRDEIGSPDGLKSPLTRCLKTGTVSSGWPHIPFCRGWG
jgi:hypothetical protein